MSMSLTCRCGKKLIAKQELAGKKGKCPECGAVFVVPKPESSDSVPAVSQSSLESQCRPWRNDPALREGFLPDYPDDLEVMFLSSRGMEIMWVSVNGFGVAGETITHYRGTLLNEPTGMQGLHKGSTVHLQIVAGAPHPLVLLDGIASPAVDQLWGHKAMALRQAEQFEKALVCYERMLQLNNLQGETWFLKATLLGTMKRFNEALAAFQEAARLGDSRAMWGIEKCQSEMG